jgi:hypothetical protein
VCVRGVTAGAGATLEWRRQGGGARGGVTRRRWRAAMRGGGTSSGRLAGRGAGHCARCYPAVRGDGPLRTIQLHPAARDERPGRLAGQCVLQSEPEVSAKCSQESSERWS